MWVWLSAWLCVVVGGIMLVSTIKEELSARVISCIGAVLLAVGTYVIALNVG